MALQRNLRYPARYENPTPEHPQGAYKNRTTETSKDGSYMEKDWLNDWDGFFSSLLDSAGVGANNTVDEVGASQYYDSLVSVINSTVPLATETTEGKAKIATQAIAEAGVNDTDIMTSFKVKQAIDANVSPKPSVTGTATFTNADNNINLTGFGDIDDLEVGDVYVVTGSASNNKTFTVEVITDSDNVIVNQAHAGGTSGKSLIDESATAGVTISLVAKSENAPIGLGQGWVDLTSSRGKNIEYTNDTNRTIYISATSTETAGGNCGIKVTIDGIVVGKTTSSASVIPYANMCVSIPIGSDYEVDVQDSDPAEIITIFSELR